MNKPRRVKNSTFASFLQLKEEGFADRGTWVPPRVKNSAFASASPVGRTVEFVMNTALISVPLYLIFYSTTFLNQLAARLTQVALELLGKGSTLSTLDGLPLLQLPGLDIQIINLCAGGIELALLAGFILASKDKSLTYRFKGIAAGFVFFSLFNAARIAVTVNSFGTVWFQPLHELLFRAVLIIALVTFYAVWYLWKE